MPKLTHDDIQNRTIAFPSEPGDSCTSPLPSCARKPLRSQLFFEMRCYHPAPMSHLKIIPNISWPMMSNNCFLTENDFQPVLEQLMPKMPVTSADKRFVQIRVCFPKTAFSRMAKLQESTIVGERTTSPSRSLAIETSRMVNWIKAAIKSSGNKFSFTPTTAAASAFRWNMLVISVSQVGSAIASSSIKANMSPVQFSKAELRAAFTPISGQYIYFIARLFIFSMTSRVSSVEALSTMRISHGLVNWFSTLRWLSPLISSGCGLL